MYDTIRRVRLGTPPPVHPKRRKHAARLLVALALFAAPLLAHADCWFDKKNGNNNGNGNRYTSSPVNFSVASPITLPFDYAYGQTLGIPVTAQPSSPPRVSCLDAQYGVANQVGGAPAGGASYMYPIGSSGISYQLTHADEPDLFMSPYGAPGNHVWFLSGSNFNVGTTLQLVQTGIVTNGYTIPANTVLANWQWGSLVPEYFVLTNSVTFLAPACRVDVGSKSISVTLPQVTTGAFTGKDSTAGATPFDIRVNCPNGSTATLQIQFDAQAGTAPGYTNVLGNQGTAGGVGVELEDGNGATVVYGQTATLGTTASGGMTLPYTAQYHAIANTVAGGTVKATATFTLSYQ